MELQYSAAIKRSKKTDLIAEKTILASCVISNNTVYKNSRPLFNSPDADLPAFLVNAYTHFKIDYPKFYKMDTLSKLGWLASEMLLAGENRVNSFQPDEIGIILSNANASLDTDIKHFNTLQGIASPAIFVYTLPNIMIGEICIRNNFKGENAFFVSSSFDAEFTESYISKLLDRQILKLCICGWVDLLETDYKAVLFLVGFGKEGQDILFTKDNIEQIFSGQSHADAG